MTFEVFFVTMLALMFGTAIVFWGYRFFLFLLPFWGFFFGLMLGAQSMQALFGEAFLATVASWVAGFILGALFAVLSYLFYFVAVGLIAGSLGYAIGVGLMGLFIPNLTFIVWLVGMVFAVGTIVATFAYNIQKYVIIVATSYLGSAVAVGTLLLGVAGAHFAKFFDNPVQVMLNDKPFWTLLFLVLFISGIVVQIKSNKGFELEAYEDRI